MVHATGEHHVATPTGQLADCLIDRDERGSARGVHCVRRAVQVHPARDPGRGQVRHQPDGRLRLGRAERAGERGPHLRQLAVAEARHHLAESVRELMGRADTLVESCDTRREVAATAEDYADLRPVAELTPGVRYRRRRDTQRDQLIRFGAVHSVHNVHIGLCGIGVDEPAAAAGHLGGEALVEPVGGHLGDGVHAVDHVVPVRVKIRCSRQEHRHPHDRDGRHVTQAPRGTGRELTALERRR